MSATPERINAVHAAIRLSGWANSKKQGSLTVAPLAFAGRVTASAAAIEVATNIDAAMYPQRKRMTRERIKDAKTNTRPIQTPDCRSEIRGDG
jgi:hypothetical protein